MLHHHRDTPQESAHDEDAAATDNAVHSLADVCSHADADAEVEVEVDAADEDAAHTYSMSHSLVHHRPHAEVEAVEAEGETMKTMVMTMKQCTAESASDCDIPSTWARTTEDLLMLLREQLRHCCTSHCCMQWRRVDHTPEVEVEAELGDDESQLLILMLRLMLIQQLRQMVTVTVAVVADTQPWSSWHVDTSQRALTCRCPLLHSYASRAAAAAEAADAEVWGLCSS